MQKIYETRKEKLKTNPKGERTGSQNYTENIYANGAEHYTQKGLTTPGQ